MDWIRVTASPAAGRRLNGGGGEQSLELCFGDGLSTENLGLTISTEDLGDPFGDFSRASLILASRTADEGRTLPVLLTLMSLPDDRGDACGVSLMLLICFSDEFGEDNGDGS